MDLTTLLLLVTMKLSCSEEEVLVQLSEGMVRGAMETSDQGQSFYSFYGIPYALPPVGARRLMRPEPVGVWEGVKGGRVVECAQENTGREELFPWGGVVRGEEDCLVVNIYTPSVGRGDLPVMVFIHGGGYFAGRSFYL